MTVSTTSGTALITTTSDTQIRITRTFNAPPRLVFKAWTTPELIKKWWSGGHGEVTVAEVDLRVGGAWRYVLVADGGFEVGFHGEFKEIVDGKRLVNTEIYEGIPESDIPAPVCTYAFNADGDRTSLVATIDCADLAQRDLILGSGMESGMQLSYDELEKVAVSLM